MPSSLRVLGIPGSLRDDSYNGRLLEFLAHHSPPEIDFRNSRHAPALPLVFSELTPQLLPDSVLKFHQEITQANGIIIATPQHNQLIPEWLKTVILWGSYPQNYWSGKPIGIIGASIDNISPDRARQQLIDLLAELDAQILSEPQINITQVGTIFSRGFEIKNQVLQSQLLDFYHRFLSFIPTVVH